MSLWIERILKEFPAELARLWIVADPDDVLLDERVLSEMRARGFDVLPFEDSIVFQTEYEERYRAEWDQGKAGPARSLVLHLRGTNINDLPWDYLRQARKVSLSLANLFPKLSYSVVQQIGAEYLEQLFEAHEIELQSVRGESETKDFILEYVFQLSPRTSIRTDADLWHQLLRIHFGNREIPAVLAQRVAQVVHGKGLLPDQPIDSWIISKSIFLHVVQVEWYRYFEKRGITGIRAGEPVDVGEWSSLEIPFEHSDVRSIVHQMFVEGALHPLQVQPSSAQGIPEWAKAGIVPDPGAMRDLVLDGIHNIKQTMPSQDSTFREWIYLSRRMGEVIARFHELDAARADGIKDAVIEMQITADKRLREWVPKHYTDLSSLPAAKAPVMVHHVPRFLSMRRNAGESKIALLVFDGLAIDQWIHIRESLVKQSPKLVFDENACFAWLPTLTSVSRQALFSGLKPREFADTIETTSPEPTQWSRFWQDQGLRTNEVLYRKGIKRTDQLADLDAALSNSSIKVAGIVVDMVDEIVHGATLGKSGIAGQIDKWCESGFVDRLFAMLLDKGFHIYLTSDHGNVDAVGQGRLNQGVTSDLRGERVRTYRTENLAAESAATHTNTYRLDIAGLPANFLPLFADGRTAFVPQGEQVVVHGGISVEELIVPFVKISFVS